MFSEAWTHIVTSQVKPKTLVSLPLQTQFNQCERSRIKMLNIYYLSWLVDLSLLFVMYVCDFRWFISNHFISNHFKSNQIIWNCYSSVCSCRLSYVWDHLLWSDEWVCGLSSGSIHLYFGVFVSLFVCFCKVFCALKWSLIFSGVTQVPVFSTTTQRLTTRFWKCQCCRLSFQKDFLRPTRHETNMSASWHWPYDFLLSFYFLMVLQTDVGLMCCRSSRLCVYWDVPFFLSSFYKFIKKFSEMYSTSVP